MFQRKYAILILVVILLFTGCDINHAYGKIKIHRFPDTTEYKVGTTDTLNLSGMEINLYLLDGTFVKTMKSEECIFTEHDPNLDRERVAGEDGKAILNQIFIDTSKVDFERAGRYTVYLYYLGGYKPDAKFKVRVVK